MPAVVEELERQSVDHDDLGMHSVRKGAAPYGSPGSTGGSFSSAILLRASWATVRSSRRHVLEGLPLVKADFDVVEPVFAATSSTVVLEHVRSIFRNLPASLTRIAEHAVSPSRLVRILKRPSRPIPVGYLP